MSDQVKRKWRCRLFGCVFRKVIGPDCMSFFGTLYMFSHCQRGCGVPNPYFLADRHAMRHPNNPERMIRKVGPDWEPLTEPRTMPVIRGAGDARSE